jgi:hypothetical protein
MTEFPATSAAAAQALVASLTPVEVHGFKLTARLVEVGLQPVAREVEGKWRWVEEPAYEVAFEGGKWGPHTLRCSVSSPERIRAHWDGYKAMHVQHFERVEALKSVPAGTTAPARPKWEVKVGDKCFFHRGMYGLWEGRIVRLYEGRASAFRLANKHQRMAIIKYRGANGRIYTSRVRVGSLSQNGIRPTVEAA